MGSELLWHVTMSLDGFIAGPGHTMDWMPRSAEPSVLADELIATTGALLVGRRTYEVEERDRGGFYGARGPARSSSSPTTLRRRSPSG